MKTKTPAEWQREIDRRNKATQKARRAFNRRMAKRLAAIKRNRTAK